MRYPVVILLLCAAVLSTGCDDSTSAFFQPQLATDTFTLAAPTAQTDGLPSALDITASQGFIAGGRYPERAADAEQWDLAVRVRNGQVVLAPAGAIGLRSRAALTRAIAGRTFDSLREAPGTGSFFTDSVAVLQTGSVYVARSRMVSGGFGGCEQYAKLQPLEVDPARGRVRLMITTNARCGDVRLAPED